MACCLLAIPIGICTVGCCHWIAKRCMLHGSMASEDWPDASPEDFKDVDRVCKLILAVYEEDIARPVFSDLHTLSVEQVIKRVTYKEAGGKCPPYMIYVDHDAKDVALVIRGLHLANRADYAVLMNNRKGQQKFDGGYVHHGLLQVAAWLLDKEFETLKELFQRYPDYTLTLGGHSLGSGVAALMTVILVNYAHELGLTRDRISCYCFAAARCTSMNLAVRYADCIKSIVLQDDFLPRTPVPLQIIFGAAFCLPCLLAFSCCKETCTSEKKKLQDPRRLYVPGRLYHIVYTKLGSCKRYPAEVRTAIPVHGRFEHLVCSMTATDDHSLVELEKKSTEAYELMLEMEKNASLDPPSEQRMFRSMSYKKDHPAELKMALEHAVSLGVYNAEEPYDGPGSAGTLEERENEGIEEQDKTVEKSQLQPQASALPTAADGDARGPNQGGLGGGSIEGGSTEEQDAAEGERGVQLVKFQQTGEQKDPIDSAELELAAEHGHSVDISGSSDASLGRGSEVASGDGSGRELDGERAIGANKATSRQSSGASDGRGSFQERRRIAEMKRKEEAALVLEEQRRAEATANAVPAVLKWEQAIEALVNRHHGQPRQSSIKHTTPSPSASRWQKAREAVRQDAATVQTAA